MGLLLSHLPLECAGVEDFLFLKVVWNQQLGTQQDRARHGHIVQRTVVRHAEHNSQHGLFILEDLLALVASGLLQVSIILIVVMDVGYSGLRSLIEVLECVLHLHVHFHLGLPDLPLDGLN